MWTAKGKHFAAGQRPFKLAHNQSTSNDPYYEYRKNRAFVEFGKTF
ncbi:surface lipoprotein assembly modifier [Neisseria chenwenguii]